MSKVLNDVQVSKIIERNQLSNMNSISLADGLYLVEKINTNVRLLYRTKKGEKCTPVLTDSQEVPKGAQSFAFATCRLFTSDYEVNMEIMIPKTFIDANIKTVFVVTVNNGFTTFKDRASSKEEQKSFLSPEIPA